MKPIPKTGSKPVCTLPNCDKKGHKSCKNKGALQKHVVTKHAECCSAACPVDGCPRTNFASFIHVDKHIRDDHLEYSMSLYDIDIIITCLFEGCEVRYKAHACYRTHLQKEHRVNQPTVLEQEKPKGHSCYVEGCNTPHKLSSPSEYDSHLIQTHGLHTPNQRRILLKGTASRWVGELCPLHLQRSIRMSTMSGILQLYMSICIMCIACVTRISHTSLVITSCYQNRSWSHGNCAICIVCSFT